MFIDGSICGEVCGVAFLSFLSLSGSKLIRPCLRSTEQQWRGGRGVCGALNWDKNQAALSFPPQKQKCRKTRNLNFRPFCSVVVRENCCHGERDSELIQLTKRSIDLRPPPLFALFFSGTYNLRTVFRISFSSASVFNLCPPSQSKLSSGMSHPHTQKKTKIGTRAWFLAKNGHERKMRRWLRKWL